MFDRPQPTDKDLQRARDEFRGMLEQRTLAGDGGNRIPPSPPVTLPSLCFVHFTIYKTHLIRYADTKWGRDEQNRSHLKASQNRGEPTVLSDR